MHSGPKLKTTLPESDLNPNTRRSRSRRSIMTLVTSPPDPEPKNKTETSQPTAKDTMTTALPVRRGLMPHPFTWHFGRLSVQFPVFALIAHSVNSLAGKCHFTYHHEDVTRTVLWVMHLAIYAAFLNWVEHLRYYGYAESWAAMKTSVTSTIEETNSTIKPITLAVSKTLKRITTSLSDWWLTHTAGLGMEDRFISLALESQPTYLAKANRRLEKTEHKVIHVALDIDRIKQHPSFKEFEKKFMGRAKKRGTAKLIQRST